jgi:hypothetical protein
VRWLLRPLRITGSSTGLCLAPFRSWTSGRRHSLCLNRGDRFSWKHPYRPAKSGETGTNLSRHLTFLVCSGHGLPGRFPAFAVFPCLGGRVMVLRMYFEGFHDVYQGFWQRCRKRSEALALLERWQRDGKARFNPEEELPFLDD